jgi:hypothetical protein
VGEREPKVMIVGDERAHVVVIDDFHPDPAFLVESAAASTFGPVVNNLYPGVRAPAPETYVREVLGRVERLAYEVFGLAGLAGCKCDFSLVTTRPDQLQLLQALPHFDSTDTGRLAVLHYLCPSEMGGTSFYRHRSTGYESITAERREPYLAKLGAELETSGLPEQAYVNGDTSLFQRIAAVDAVYNRLVIYRSVVLHSGNIRRDFVFDTDPRKGRLTLNTFLSYGPG